MLRHDRSVISYSPDYVQLPDEARTMAIQQLETLSGVAKGLTRSTDGILIFSEEDPETQVKLDEMMRAREDVRMAKLRDAIFVAVRGAVDRWSTDAEVSHVSLQIFHSKVSYSFHNFTGPQRAFQVYYLPPERYNFDHSSCWTSSRTRLSRFEAPVNSDVAFTRDHFDRTTQPTSFYLPFNQ